MLNILKLIFYCTVFCWRCISCNQDQNKNIGITNSNTDLAKGPEDGLLLFSTLDGSFIAVEQQTGHIRWKHKDEPTVKVPIDTSHAINPIILPDPKDGSLYLLKNDDTDALKKLPFTIPQLVASTPCRSSDGILYTGKKIDQWFLIDPRSGRRESVLGWEEDEQKKEQSNTCPLSPNKAIYVGRTHYEVMMIDGGHKSGHKRKWNVTFTDYASSSMSNDMIKNYEMIHFTASSSGSVVTLDRDSGRVLWNADLGSPAVAAYISTSTGLLSVPFTSLAHNTLQTIAKQPTPQTEIRLYPTLYVGEHNHGLYALPSLVDENTVIISQKEPLLIEGPSGSLIGSEFKMQMSQFSGQNFRLPLEQFDSDILPIFPNAVDNKINIIILGHYRVPEYSKTRLQIEGRNDPVIPPLNIDKDVENDSDIEQTSTNNVQFKSTSSDKYNLPVNFGSSISVAVQTDNRNEDIPQHTEEASFLSQIYWNAKEWINHQDNKGLKLSFIILVGCMIAMFWYFNAQVREFQQLSQGSRDFSNGSGGPITAIPEELKEGKVKVGKIVFYPEEILGRGCEGTFVYRGEFEGRSVAVKRLLPECFSLADREVSLLQESDAHPHVIRYHCTERDRQFRYIALELCVTTLYDYVTSPRTRFKNLPYISNMSILKQATAGLAHLHSLDIVHRDIKPQNVLLWVGRGDSEVRAMISDFGLCKKLQYGRTSFSRRSGLTGTDGWIAPEMLHGKDRTTTAVDIFSLGCVFYFVLSDGKHPFGEPLRRQANILMGTYKLTDLCGTANFFELAYNLIKSMLYFKPHLRPPATAVEKHPLFWSRARMLAFFQDVSDRIEKADHADIVLMKLESHNKYIVRDDWRQNIDAAIATDLRKFRSYRGDSVRDLLRALRNKKHHYRELSAEVQNNLGSIPDDFTDYWTNRFPLLLIHTWISFQFIRNEPLFKSYYHETYDFPEQSYENTLNCMFSSDNDIQFNIKNADSEKVLLQDNSNINHTESTGYHNLSKHRQKHNFQNDVNSENVTTKPIDKNSPNKSKKQFINNYTTKGNKHNNDAKALTKLQNKDANQINVQPSSSNNIKKQIGNVPCNHVEIDNRDNYNDHLNYDWRIKHSLSSLKMSTQHMQKFSNNKSKKSHKHKNNDKPLVWNLSPETKES